MLSFPVNVDFFPSLQLTLEETQYYHSLAEQSVTILSQLVREDQWKRISDSKGLSIGKCHFIQAAQACVMLCASVYTTGTVQEVLEAIASPNTTEYRKSMAFLHPERFEDAVCLHTLPSTQDSITTMIKWAAFKDDLNKHTTSSSSSTTNSSSLSSSSSSSSSSSGGIDYCYLEQAGTRTTPSLIGYCIQESIVRDREVPVLYGFGLKRQQLHRTGYIILPTDREDVVQISSMFQMVSGILPSSQLEKMMIQRVSAVQRIASLLDRRRLSRTPLLAKAHWVKDEERRHCALCLKLFALRRKHHCRHCGEVVCSVCAPPREVDVGACGTALVRVCTACVLDSRKAMKLSYIRDRKVLCPNIGHSSPILGRTHSTPVTSSRPEYEIETPQAKRQQSEPYRRSESLSLYSLYDDRELTPEPERKPQRTDPMPIPMVHQSQPIIPQYPSSWASSDSNFSIASPSEYSPHPVHNSPNGSSSSISSWGVEEELSGYTLESERLQSFSSSLSSQGYSFSEYNTFHDASVPIQAPVVPDVPSPSRSPKRPQKNQGLMLYVPDEQEISVDRKSTDSIPSNGSSSSLLELLASIRDMRVDLTTATTHYTNQQESHSPRASESFWSMKTRPRSDANTALMMASREESEDNQVCDMALITSDSFNLLQPQPLSQRRSTRTSSLSTSSFVEEEMEEEDGGTTHGSELAQLRNHIDALRCSLKVSSDPQHTRSMVKHHVEMMERELEAVERKQKPHVSTTQKQKPLHDPVVKARQQVYHTLMEELHEIMGLPTL